jgi:hypothetical protein
MAESRKYRVKLHPYRKHRKQFNAEMLKLAQCGAFNDLW